MTTVGVPTLRLGLDLEDQLGRLLRLRGSLLGEKEAAPSPAVARALEMADMYLFLGMSYLGYVDELYPEER